MMDETTPNHLTHLPAEPVMFKQPDHKLEQWPVRYAIAHPRRWLDAATQFTARSLPSQ
jgi:hypothetical protein